MEAIRVQQVIAEDGEVVIPGLPYKKGQTVTATEIILRPHPARPTPRSRLTVGKL